VRENVADKTVEVISVSNKMMWADILTKGTMTVESFSKCRDIMMGMTLTERSGSVGSNSYEVKYEWNY
jgi:hypothetical protein